jgi:hypothetical protein
MFNQLIKERRYYEKLEDGREDRDCGTYRIVRSRWRLCLRTGNDLAASPAGITSGGAVCYAQEHRGLLVMISIH